MQSLFSKGAADRRRFLGGSARGALAGIGWFALSTTHARGASDSVVEVRQSGGALVADKQIQAGVLNVAYADLGPRDGQPVLLLHGWPYDVQAFGDVAPRLASAGLRVIVPYLRGYGATRFLRDETPRNGQPAALASDAVALLDAL